MPLLKSTVAQATILTVDVARWPLAVLTYAGSPTLRDLENHLREIEEKVLASGRPFIQIIDQTKGDVPTAMQRALIADHQSKNGEAYQRYCLGEAYVCTSRMRSAMIAVFWQAMPAYPYTFVRTLEEGMVWANQRWLEYQGNLAREKR